MSMIRVQQIIDQTIENREKITSIACVSREKDGSYFLSCSATQSELAFAIALLQNHLNNQIDNTISEGLNDGPNG